MCSPRRWCTAIPVVLSALALMAHGATIKFDQSQTGDYNLQIHLKNIELYAVFDDSGGSDDEYGDLPDYTDPTDAPSKPPPAAIASSTTATPQPSPPSQPYNNSSSSGNGSNINSNSGSGSNSNSNSNSGSGSNGSGYGGNGNSGSTAASVLASSTEAVASSAAALLDPYSPSNSDKIVQMVEALIASNGNASDMPAEPPPPSAAASSPQQQPLSASSQQQSPPAAVALQTAASASSTANRKCGPGYFRDPMGRCRRIRKPHLPFLQMVHTPGVIKSFQPQLRTTEDESTSKN